jgi:hypothetical protein
MSFIYFMAIFGLGCFCGYVNGLHRGRRQAEEKYFEEYIEQDDDDYDPYNIMSENHDDEGPEDKNDRFLPNNELDDY